MADEKRDNYDIEPDSEIASQSDLPKPRQVGIPRAEHVQPLKLEEDFDDSDEPRRSSSDQSKKSSVKDLDVCPSCGATMRGADSLVCIRCGFDLKTMRQVKTVTGETTAPPPGESIELQPLVKPGNGNLWLPTILAAVSGIVLLIGFLAGARALFPNIAVTTEAGQVVAITAGTRFIAILKTIVLVGMLSACGIGALAFVAYLNGMRLARNWDDLKLAAVRMLAIVVTMRLAAFIVLPNQFLETAGEAIVQPAIFAALAIALFRLKPGDSLILTGAAIMMFILLWLAAYVTVWATW